MVKKSFLENLLIQFVKLLIGMILIFPTIMKVPKIILMGIIIVIIIITNQFKLTYHSLIWTGIFFLANCIFLAKGVLKSPDVFFQLFSVNLVWPFLFLVVVVVPLSCYRKLNFSNVFLASGFIISVVTLYIYISYQFQIPIIPILNNYFPFSINEYTGYVSFFTPSITSLFFITIFAMILILEDSKNVNKFFCYVVLILNIVAVILIGRRALLMNLAVIPIIFYLIKLINRRVSLKFMSKITFLIIAFIVSFFIVLEYFNLNLRILNTIDAETFQSDLRIVQYKDLIASWKKVPLFGAGFGINSDTVVRSKTVPGAYELSYVALLFQTGVIGFITYISLYLNLFIEMFNLLKCRWSSYHIAILMGYVSILIANFTNPYIRSFDGLWIIFFMLGTIANIKLNEEIKEYAEV